jgi:hypothetical protein
MDLASLPKFPIPEPPATKPRVANCRRTLPLRFFIVLVIWGGLYILREQITAITAAREKEATECRESGVGKWESVHDDGAILELADGHFTLSRGEAILARGDYAKYRDSYRIEFTSGCDIYYLYGLMIHYRVEADELILATDPKAHSRFCCLGFPSAQTGSVRFRRLSE